MEQNELPKTQEELLITLIEKVTEKSKKTTFLDKLKMIGVYLALIAGSVSIVQQLNIASQNSAITDRLDAKDAYVSVGLRNLADKSQKNFVKAIEIQKTDRKKLERFQDYCHNKCFDVPSDLMAMAIEPVYDAMESPEKYFIEQSQLLVPENH